MEVIRDKLLLISKLNNLNENLAKSESVVKTMNIDNTVNEINNNSLKMFKISVEFNAFDVNEDKQRQCYKQLKCFWPKCRYSCKNEFILKEHNLEHLNKRRFVCDECNKQFNRKTILLTHKRNVHSTDGTFVCNRNDCNKIFKSKAFLLQHQLTHSSVKSFGCNKCEKRFITNAKLRIHEKFVHLNFRPFVCPQIDCNQRFKRQEHLNRHKRMHCSDKPFECEKCNQRYKHKSSLILHKLIHSDVKQFKCNDCNKGFNQRSGLNYHNRRFHSDIKPHFKCFHENCDKSFLISSRLKLHIRYKHSTDRPYKCDFQNCYSSFKSPGNLSFHKKTVHLKSNV